jgi:hypothetical protein
VVFQTAVRVSTPSQPKTCMKIEELTRYLRYGRLVDDNRQNLGFVYQPPQPPVTGP